MTLFLIALAFGGVAIGLSWMCVLLKRELEAVWSDMLNGIAKEMR